MDGIFYQTVIQGFLANRKTDDSTRVLLDAMQNQVLLRHDLYNQVLKAIL